MEIKVMKIAMATLEESMGTKLDQTFGRAVYFLFHDTENGENKFIENPARNASGGAGIKSAQTLVDEGVEALIVFRLGSNAVQVLEGANVKCFRAVDESAQVNLDKFIAGELAKLEDFHPGYHHTK
jgi:predicted Fe-Mo cluster-binding NifX family protein